VATLVIIAAAAMRRAGGGETVIRVVLRDGSCQDVAGAHDAERRGGEIVMADTWGRVVARFDCTALLAYGPPETLPGTAVPYQPVKPRPAKQRPASCAHVWSRLKSLEEVLDIVVYVRECSHCGRLEAKSGHKDPSSDESWVAIASEATPG
jgi:hypothetical protein